MTKEMMTTEQYCGKCERPLWVHSSFGKQECPPEDLVLGEPEKPTYIETYTLPLTANYLPKDEWHLDHPAYQDWVAAVKEWETKVTAEFGPQS